MFRFVKHEESLVNIRLCRDQAMGSELRCETMNVNDQLSR